MENKVERVSAKKKASSWKHNMRKEAGKVLQTISFFLHFISKEFSLNLPTASKILPTFASLNLHQRVWRNENVSQVCLSAVEDFLSLATMFFWLFGCLACETLIRKKTVVKTQPSKFVYLFLNTHSANSLTRDDPSRKIEHIAAITNNRVRFMRANSVLTFTMIWEYFFVCAFHLHWETRAQHIRKNYERNLLFCPSWEKSIFIFPLAPLVKFIFMEMREKGHTTLRN